MNFEIDVTDGFKREAKKLIKKYVSLKSEIDTLISELEQDPTLGTSIGKDCYKIRLSISSKGKGKSGGARVITYVHVRGTTVYLLSIYDKSEQSDISEKKLKQLLDAL